MPLIIRAEYLEIDGVPLATPAWECVDLSALYDAPPVRGDDVAVPYHEGALAFRRIVGARRVTLPLAVFGDFDENGVRYADARDGLRANLDRLKRDIVRPVQSTSVGTRVARHHLPAGLIRRAPCHVLGPMQVAALGPVAVRAALEVSIPGAVLRDEAATVATSGSVAAPATADLVVANPGTADQYELVITLTGTASAVRLTNLTWDPALGTYLEFNGTLGGGVTIDTAKWTAVRDGVSVIGLIAHAGHERWLPLAPGNNTIRIAPTGGNVTVSVSHLAAYL